MLPRNLWRDRRVESLGRQAKEKHFNKVPSKNKKWLVAGVLEKRIKYRYRFQPKHTSFWSNVCVRAFRCVSYVANSAARLVTASLRQHMSQESPTHVFTCSAWANRDFKLNVQNLNTAGKSGPDLFLSHRMKQLSGCSRCQKKSQLKVKHFPHLNLIFTNVVNTTLNTVFFRFGETG